MGVWGCAGRRPRARGGRAGDHLPHDRLQRQPRRRVRSGDARHLLPGVGLAPSGRGARGPCQHLPEGGGSCQGPRQTRTHRHARARGRQDRGPLLPHRPQALRGQLAGPAEPGLHRHRQVPGRVVPHDQGVLRRVPAHGLQGQAPAALRPQPQQDAQLRNPHARARGARRQDHRLFRQHPHPRDVRAPLRPPHDPRQDLRGGTAAGAHQVPRGRARAHHLPLRRG
mmetsp:Transcript_22837/g.67284  ORF Transcript_22837/g.67284 Transcript_22837/m.67284 type:complete len:225 (+) Transcript_22837:206-880(+)